MDRFIEIDEVVANASTFVEQMTDELATIMRQWVWFAMRSIGPNNADIEVEEVEIINNSAVKPAGMTGNILELGVYTEGGSEIPYRYNFAGGPIHEEDRKRNKIDIYEDANSIHFSDFNLKPAYIKLKYYRLPLDDCGLPKIPESYLLAIIAYINYAYQIRKANDFGMIGYTERTWNTERERIRAKNKSVAGVKAKQILKEWNTMLPKQRYNRF